jgi:hypothetical protein
LGLGKVTSLSLFNYLSQLFGYNWGSSQVCLWIYHWQWTGQCTYVIWKGATVVWTPHWQSWNFLWVGYFWNKLYVSVQDLGTNFWLNHDYYDYNKYNGYNGLTSIMKIVQRWIWVCFLVMQNHLHNDII